MSTVYEPGTIATWTTSHSGRKVAVRRDDDHWEVSGGSLVKYQDYMIAQSPNVEILDPLQLDWRKKFEQQSSRLEVLKQQLATTTEDLRARYVDLHNAERKVILAQNAAKDIERLKDAEIAKLKAKLAAQEDKSRKPLGLLGKLDLLRDTLVEAEDLMVKLQDKDV